MIGSQKTKQPAQVSPAGKTMNCPLPAVPSTSSHPATNNVSPPGPPTLQEALQRIQALEMQNTKLYEDNCQLATAVHMLNERHVFLSKPTTVQLQCFTSMQERLRLTEANHAVVCKQHQDLIASLANGSAHHQLVSQLQQTRLDYAHLSREYNHLLDRHSRLKIHCLMNNHTEQPAQLPPAGVTVPTMPVNHAHNVGAMAFPQRTPKQLPGDVTRDVPRSHGSPMSPRTNALFAHKPLQFHESRRTSDGHVTAAPFITNRAPPSSLPTPSASAPLPVTTPQLLPPMPIESMSRYPAQSAMSAPSVSTLMALPRVMPAPGIVPQPRHTFIQDPQPSQARGPREVVDLTGEESGSSRGAPFGPANPQTPSTPPISESLKRPNPAIESPTRPSPGQKRLRVDEPDQGTAIVSAVSEAAPPVQNLNLDMDTGCSPTMHTSSNPVTNTADNVETKLVNSSAAFPPASAVGKGNDHKLSPSGDENLRPYEECVSLIFEKDADVDNGVFCEACL
ncbi:hypothetical protein ID866_6925 [Astraeus odoratus]|nr:hypothetical protein ID866_6925 [Astraeus odoratus]